MRVLPQLRTERRVSSPENTEAANAFDSPMATTIGERLRPKPSTVLAPWRAVQLMPCATSMYR
jgi:hypothetical protein